jgi:hypothetical protein
MGDVDFLSGLGDQDRDDEDEEGDEDKDAEGLDVRISPGCIPSCCLSLDVHFSFYSIGFNSGQDLRSLLHFSWLTAPHQCFLSAKSK